MHLVALFSKQFNYICSWEKESCTLLKHPEAEESLEGIVDNHQCSNFIRFSIFHESWPNYLDTINIEDTDDGGWPNGGHERPAVNSRIPEVNHEIVVGILDNRLSKSSLFTFIKINLQLLTLPFRNPYQFHSWWLHLERKI